MSHCIIAGSYSKLLAEKIASNLDLQLISPRVAHFVNSEMKITLPENISNFEECTIVQSTSNPANDNIIEICLLVDTLKREGIKKINAIIPYYGYARQDKQHLPRECVSVDVISKLFRSIGIQKIITVDIHNQNSLNLIDIEMQNISAIPTMAKYIYQKLGLDETSESQITIASPDDGGINRAQVFSENFYKNPKNREIVSIKKTRHLDKEHYCEAVELRGNINDKRLILIDDVSTSGGTLINALELCKANGVLDLFAVIIHPDFAKGVAERLQNSSYKKFFTTNSIENTVENLSFFDKIEVVDISSIFEI